MRVTIIRKIFATGEIFSQFGEDGLIQYLIKNLNINNKKFIEFGVENYSEAIKNLLFIIENNKDWNKSKAKKELLDLFSLLGDSDPLTLEGRSKLSNLIFK